MYHCWLKWDFLYNIQINPHWASAAMRLTRQPQGLDAVTDNYNFSRRKSYESVDKYSMSRFHKANKCHLYWPADPESKPFYGLWPVIIQMNLPCKFLSKSLNSRTEFWKKKSTYPYYLKQVISLHIEVEHQLYYLYLKLKSDLPLCSFIVPEFRQLIPLSLLFHVSPLYFSSLDSNPWISFNVC